MDTKKRAQKKLKIGLIGLGAMGKGLLYQSLITPDIDCRVICDLHLAKCIDALHSLGLEYRVAENPREMHEALSQDQIVVCEDGELVAQCELLDAVVESSSSIGPAGNFAVKTLQSEKHLILMNSEIDLLFGPYLMQLAAANNVTFTSCDGDQYGVINHLIDDLQFWGFELVMAGNIKGYLDRYVNPDLIIPEADKRNLDYNMCTAYTDGTKLSIEMAIVANTFGLSTLTPGMYGFRTARVEDVFQVFDFAQIWENKVPFVDYILGAEPGGGVFVIGYCNNDYQRQMMQYYKMGNGPFYLFYRPYHLCHVESMKSILAVANQDERYLMQPKHGFCTNVYTYAKRDLKAGESLDGHGGFTCYGLIENTSDNETNPGLPICLAENLTIKRHIRKDEKIHLADVLWDSTRPDFALYLKALSYSDNYLRGKEKSR